jgi:mercuric ion binding protein
MKKAVAIIALFFAAMPLILSGRDGNEAKVQIKTSAVCKMCKATIEKYLAYEKGVKVSDLDVPSKVVTVVYNPKKTDISKIKKAINKSGYDADELPADAKAYDALEACCKKDAPSHVD